MLRKLLISDIKKLALAICFFYKLTMVSLSNRRYSFIYLLNAFTQFTLFKYIFINNSNSRINFNLC